MRNYLLGLWDKWNRLGFPFRSAFLICVGYLLWYVVEHYFPQAMDAFLFSRPMEWFTQLHSTIFGVLFPSLLPFSIEQVDNLFRLENGVLLRIMWGCTALKVYLIFLLAQLLYYKPSLRLLQRLGLTLLLVFLLNTVRVYLTFIAHQYMPHYGALVHDLLGKALYVIIYLLWYVYDGQNSRKAKSIATT